MLKVRAIVFHEHGDPATTTRVEEIVVPEPGAGEVRVRMLFAPINPADLNVIEGKYPIRPSLPGVPGVEGSGVVEQCGADIHGLSVGTQVLLPHGVGTWREACVVPASKLIAVPPAIAAEQAAMLKINPATALRMLHDFVSLQAGDWIIQNAANSGVGRAVAQIARAAKIRTVNIVRRPELLEDFARADELAFLDDERVIEQVARATDRAPIRLALNAVGGESAVRLANCLEFGGTIVTYGAMGRQPLRIPNGLLIFKDQRWRGFWITHWLENAPVDVRMTMFRQLFQLAEDRVLQSPIEQVFTLDNAHAALLRAQQPGRSGKILLRLSN